MTARLAFFSVCLGLLVGNLFAAPHVPLPPPCVAGTLASYIALGSPGCSIDILRFNEFDFDVVTSAGGAVPISEADIIVTPSFATPSAMLTFSSSGFAVSGTESVSYLIAYTVDPHPEIFDFFLDMSTFTPVAPGTVDITADLCVGAAFSGSSCSTTVETLHVFHHGATSDLSDGVAFTPVNTVGVRNTIDLAANGASADFSSLSNRTGIVPEPGTMTLVACALVAAAGLRRRLAR